MPPATTTTTPTTALSCAMLLFPPTNAPYSGSTRNDNDENNHNKDEKKDEMDNPSTDRRSDGESWGESTFWFDDHRRKHSGSWCRRCCCWLWWWRPTMTTASLVVVLLLLLVLLSYLVSMLWHSSLPSSPSSSSSMQPCLASCGDTEPSESLVHTPPPPPQYRVVPIRAGAVVARLQFDTNAPCVVEIPDWIPPKRRAHPSARYYLYYSSHTTLYISLSWSKTLYGPWIPHHTVRGPFVTPRNASSPQPLWTRGVMDFEADRDRWDWDHVASPDVTFDRQRKRVILYFHGRNGLYRVHHASFVATSKWGLNFNGPAAGGEGHGYGPITTTWNNHSIVVCVAQMYPRVFYRLREVVVANATHNEPRGPYLMSKRGVISRPRNFSDPFTPPPGRESSCFWKESPPPASWQTSDARDIQPHYVSPLATFLASTEFANHPHNPIPGTRLSSQTMGQGWNANHVALSPLHDGTGRMEVYFWIKKRYRDLYRVVLDVSSSDWKEWHLARDPTTNQVYLDTIVTPQEASRQVRARLPAEQQDNATGHAVAMKSMGDAFVVDRRGDKILFVSYDSEISSNAQPDVVGQGQITSFRLVPV